MPLPPARMTACMPPPSLLICWPPSRALRWLREACPRRRDTATAPGAPYAAFGPAAAARRCPWLTDGVSLAVLAGVVAGQVARLLEPLDGLLEPLLAGVARLPSGALAQPGRVTAQPQDLGVLRAQPARVLADIGVRAHQPGDIRCQLANRHVRAGAG